MRRADARAAAAPGERAPPLPPPAAPPLDEDEAEAAVAELRAHRDLWHWDEQDAYEHFYVDARGGRSTKRMKGEASDCVAVWVRGHASGWCVTWSCNRMRSFSYRAHGGEAVCHMLAREWCAKQNYYYPKWLEASSQPDFDFDAVEWFTLSDAFYDALEDIDPLSATFQRLAELAEWVPKRSGRAA